MVFKKASTFKLVHCKRVYLFAIKLSWILKFSKLHKYINYMFSLFVDFYKTNFPHSQNETMAELWYKSNSLTKEIVQGLRHLPIMVQFMVPHIVSQVPQSLSTEPGISLEYFTYCGPPHFPIMYNSSLLSFC